MRTVSFMPQLLYPCNTKPPFSAHWIGCWLGLRAGMGLMKKGTISCPCRESNPCRPARSLLLYRELLVTGWIMNRAVRLMEWKLTYDEGIICIKSIVHLGMYEIQSLASFDWLWRNNSRNLLQRNIEFWMFTVVTVKIYIYWNVARWKSTDVSKQYITSVIRVEE
jgi:hypothetical protein